MPDAPTLGRPPRAPDLPAGPPGFELLEELGRGGMGVVYRAWDADFGREVAVKLLRPDLPADAGTRFADEARITGQLQHPGVPPAYRVGTTPDGRPFLAMKLIHGRTLGEMLRAGDPVDVAAVFEGVAQAVGYAHAHGVVHRDLKPSNVMVGAFGEVQVMDWGLAKVLGAGRPAGDPAEAPTVPGVSSLRDAETVAGSVLGTPGYMAPEQAAGRSAEIDARTDVFGLGAILCVLLTGQPPFAGEDTVSVRRRAARGDTAGAFARLDGCGADPGLIALGKRCLAFAPADRPGSGNAVAEAVAGLRRAADARAAEAERARVAADVRAAEAGRRRRLVLAGAGGLVAVLLVGVAGTGYGLIRADAARRAEAGQRATAEAKEADATAVVEFFQDKVLAAGRPAGQRGGLGKDVTLRDAVAAAAPALGERFAGRPGVEARLRYTLGQTLITLSDPKAAMGQLDRAAALFAEAGGPDDPDALRSRIDLGVCLNDLARPAEAAALLERAAADCRRVFGPDHKDTLSALNNLSVSYSASGRAADVLRLREDVLAAKRRSLGPDHPDTLAGLSNVANSLVDAGRPDEALRLREQVLADRRRVLGPDHPDTLSIMTNLAISYEKAGRAADALLLREDALAVKRRVLGPDHLGTLLTIGGLANSYAAADRDAEALALREEAMATSRRVLGPDHPDALSAANNLANSYAEAGRDAEALAIREGVLAGKRRVLGPDHPSTWNTMNNLANSYAGVGRQAEALSLREEVYAGRRKRFGPDHPDTLTAGVGLAESLVGAGRGAEALPLLDACLSKLPKKGSAADAAVLRARHFKQAGDPAGCRATAETWEKIGRADGHYTAAAVRAVAAGAYASTGRAAEAAADADRAMAWLAKAAAAGRVDRGEVETDADLAPVRGRADFARLVASLPEAAPPPRPARTGVR
jgi:tetratricopeptide (TPR) repeat protein/predicted Ser/Thr protein kinase